MSKDAFWFSHDYTARNDDKILELRSEYGAEGYGIFWMLVETMAENDNGGIKAGLIGGLSHGFGVAKDRLLAVLKMATDIGLFYEENGYFFSRRMMKHKEVKQKFKEFGEKGAKKRWKNSPPIAPPMLKTGQDMIRQDNKDNIKKNKSQFPLATDFNGLPDDKIGSAIELLRITQKVTVTITDVNGLWNVFKVENLTGENFYQTHDKVYTHFIRWVKGQPIKNESTNGTASQPKIIM